MGIDPVSICKTTGKVTNPTFKQDTAEPSKSIVLLQDLYYLLCMLRIAKEATGTPSKDGTIAYFGEQLSQKEYPKAYDTYVKIHGKDPERTATKKIQETIIALYKKLSEETQGKIGLHIKNPDYTTFTSDKLANISSDKAGDMALLRDLIKLATMLEIARRATGNEDTTDTITFYGSRLSGVEPEVDGTFDVYVDIHKQKTDRAATRKVKLTILRVWDRLDAETKKLLGPINDPTVELTEEKVLSALTSLCAPAPEIPVAKIIPTLTVEPQTLEPGEETNIYVTLTGIDTEELKDKALYLDVQDKDENSLLLDQTLIKLEPTQMTVSDATVTFGTQLDIDEEEESDDPSKKVKITVAAETKAGTNAKLVLLKSNQPIASTDIGISGKEIVVKNEKENKGENASAWMRKYLNPTVTLSMTFANEAGGKDENPLAESVLRAPEPYNIGLRLNPTIGITQWVDLTLDAGATAQFDHDFDLRRSDYVAGSGLGINLGPITIGGSYGVKYFDSDTTTPSLSTPYDMHLTQTMEGYARLRSDSWETKIFYRHNWMDYNYNDDVLLGTHFIGKGKTHEFGGEFKLKHEDANLTVGGSYFKGSREVYDTFAGNPEKDINGGSIYANLLLPSIWSDPYLNLLYSGAHDGGSLKQYLFSARLGADLLPSFWGNQKNILEFLFYANRETGYIDAQALGLGLSWKPEYLPTLSFTWERQIVDAPIISEDSRYDQFVFGVDLAPIINNQIKEK